MERYTGAHTQSVSWRECMQAEWWPLSVVHGSVYRVRQTRAISKCRIIFNTIWCALTLSLCSALHNNCNSNWKRSRGIGLAFIRYYILWIVNVLQLLLHTHTSTRTTASMIWKSSSPIISCRCSLGFIIWQIHTRALNADHIICEWLPMSPMYGYAICVHKYIPN